MALCFFFFQAEDGIRDADVTGVQTCALPIHPGARRFRRSGRRSGNRTGAGRSRRPGPGSLRRRLVAARLLAPDARNPPAARGAPPVRAYPLLFDPVPDTLDEQVAAIWAIGVLPAADPTREVAGVDELEAGARPDVTRAEQRVRRGVVGVGHLVVLVERGHVPRDLG